jgi:hypothetical protein
MEGIEAKYPDIGMGKERLKIIASSESAIPSLWPNRV